MPYQVGDKIRVRDILKNRNHRTLARFVGQEFMVVGVADREPWDIPDGNGGQNLRLAGLDGAYNDIRFEFAVAAPVIDWEAAFADPARPFVVGQLVQTGNFIWAVRAVLPDRRIRVQAIEQKNPNGFGGIEIGHIAEHFEGQFDPLDGMIAPRPIPVLGAINMQAELANAIIKPAMPIEFQAGDVVTLTKDEDRQQIGDICFPDLMVEWADEGREFTVDYKVGDLWRVVNDDGNGFVYEEEWFDMAKAKLKEGDLLWYIDHTIEGKRGAFVKEANRPTYYLNKILENGKFEVQVWQDDAPGVHVGTYAADLWMKNPVQEKAKAKPADPVIDPKVQAEKIEKMVADCVEYFAEHAGGCANFYLISQKKNGDLSKLGGTYMPCHYELRGGYGDQGKGTPVVVIDSIHRRREALPKYKQQGFIDYVTYLLNRSPWADCYLTNDFEDAEKNGIRMNLDMTANQLVGACIAMRQSSEFSQILPVHTFLKSKRFSGDVCFLVGQYYTMSADGVVTPLAIDSGHTILTDSMPADDVFKFFATKEFVGEDKKKPYKESKAYSNIFGSITGCEEYARAKPGDVTIKKFMKGNCVAEEVGAGLGKKFVVTEASLLKLARAVKAELNKYKVKQPVEA